MLGIILKFLKESVFIKNKKFSKRKQDELSLTYIFLNIYIKNKI